MNILTFFKDKSALNAALLISGCCIGAGMIGLPVLEALAGFMPSTLAMLACYFFTTATGLLLLEATLWFDGQVNLPSIVEFTLGKIGKFITLILFTFLFYCLFVAYLDGGGSLFADMLTAIFHHPISHTIGILTCVIFVSTLTYASTRLLNNLNRGLIAGLILSYVILVFVGLPQVKHTHLTYTDWKATFATVPILLICFGYHNLVPSLTYYLKKNVNAIRFAIIIGNLMPFFIYFIWNFVILGMLSPQDTHSTNGAEMVTQLLQNASSSFAILFFVKTFSLFAMLTSFLPSAVSFVDFLRDGLKRKNEIVLSGLVFLPPLLCALFYPNLFLQALGFAGGFIDVLLFAILPATVILVGRNIKKIVGPYQVAGGNLTPVIILLLSFGILAFKLLPNLG